MESERREAKLQAAQTEEERKKVSRVYIRSEDFAAAALHAKSFGTEITMLQSTLERGFERGMKAVPLISQNKEIWTSNSKGYKQK